MRVGVVGIGDIARKAYLPVLAATPGIELHLATRNERVLHEVGDRYGIARRTQHLDGLVEAGVQAAFVHAATAAHPDIVRRLLAHGVHVYVDKPAATSADVTAELVAAAEQAGRILVVGFNRRFAPRYRAVAQHDRELVVMRKDRPDLPAPARAVVFDDFIHVVDTLRWLAPGAELVDVRGSHADGRLRHVVVTLAGAGRTAIGIMDRVSGRTDEVLEASGPGGTRTVQDLQALVDHRGDRRVVEAPGHWESALERMGFVAIVGHFLDAVAGGAPPRPPARDALATHELCERIVRELGAR